MPRRPRPGSADAKPLAPGRWVVYPAAADHRRDDLDLRQLGWVERERVAVEHDEVGEAAGEERAADAFVVRKPRGSDARRVQRLLERDRLVGPPRRAGVGCGPG